MTTIRNMTDGQLAEYLGSVATDEDGRRLRALLPASAEFNDIPGAQWARALEQSQRVWSVFADAETGEWVSEPVLMDAPDAWTGIDTDEANCDTYEHNGETRLLVVVWVSDDPVPTEPDYPCPILKEQDQ